ncbi:MAG: hypothetical protein JXJ22_05925, partial [Bacteroidales bacterium]|nr:hypothetical protein [Bacteroidales bacterium]
MNFIYKFLPERIIESLGWTLVHSIWQGAIIALLLGFVLLITNKFTSGTRYLIAVAALVLVITGSAFTFVKTYLNYDEVQISAFETRVWQDNEESVTPVVPVLSEPEIVNDKVELKFQVQNFKNYFYTNFPLIVTLWLLGMLIFMLKFLGGLAYTQRIKHYRISAVE